MRRSPSPLRSILVVCALGLVACADRGPLAPPAQPALDVGAEDAAPPDSGALVLYPSDDVYVGDYGAGEEGGAAPQGLSLQTVSVQSASPNIRIGVVQASSAVLLGSTGDYTIRDRANGVLVMSGTNGTATVTLAAVPEVYLYLQVTCSSVAAVSARKAAAEALGYFTLTEAIAACTRLLIGRLPTNATTAQRTTFRNTLIAQGLAGTDSFFRTITIGNQTVYRITRGTTSVQNLNPVVVTSTTGIVTIGTSATTLRRYRGKGEARINSSATLAGINELPVEQYLYGVVPRELGPTVFPEIEAQKAQAVAARTFAIAGFGRRGSDGYDLRATVDDQVYGGYADEHPVSTAAVDATAGVVATYGGTPISANFSSTSGGHTANNEESFNGAPVPYLRGVPDAERGEALQHVPSLEVFKAHANPTSLRAAREGDFESDWARLHRWTFQWTMAEISSVISDLALTPVGRVLAINVLERGPSGRVIRIEYVTENGTFTSEKGGIRSSLRYFDANGVKTNLPSTLFFIEPLRDPSTKALLGYRVYGGGFGHGVGLGQTGAVGMAQKGHSYDQILKHYYQGIALTQWY